jgi:hypothetical protein
MVKIRERHRECFATGKTRFLSANDAQDAINRARKDRALRMFLCKTCLGWHVTRLKNGDRHAMESGKPKTR